MHIAGVIVITGDHDRPQCRATGRATTKIDRTAAEVAIYPHSLSRSMAIAGTDRYPAARPVTRLHHGQAQIDDLLDQDLRVLLLVAAG